MHEQKNAVRYIREMLGAIFIYALMLVLVHQFGFHMHEGLVRTMVLVSPMVPVLLVVWAVVRQIRRVDEYQRLQALENIAIAASVTVGWTFTYGFLENAGFPRLSMFTVWEVMGTVWAVVAITRMMANR